MLALSWLGAIVACLGYGVSSVLQSVAAKRAAEVVGLTGIVLIIKQVPYLLGLAADTMAFAGNVLALQRLPLFLVQSIVAGSVGVTAVIASLRGARLSWKDWTSLAVLGRRLGPAQRHGGADRGRADSAGRRLGHPAGLRSRRRSSDSSASG